MILAAGEPANAFADPTFWVNLGAVGVIAGAFMAGKLHSNGELNRVEKSCAAALAAQEKAHTDAQQRGDDQIRQLLLERDRANRERDEAISVMRDFTLMAGTIFDNKPSWKPPTRRSGGKERADDV